MDGIRRHKTRFTLIELLAVVALISVLMAVGVPAFARMVRGSKVDESARNIKLALEQAQMRAASERCYVAVIFPNGSVSDQLKPYRLGGFRTAYVKYTVDDEGNEEYKFSKWADDEWRNAPDGAILTRIGDSDFTPAADAADITISGCTAAANSSLQGAGSLAEITGVKDDSGGDLNVGGNAAIIFTPYGEVLCGSKLYLLVAEAVVEGDKITYPNGGNASTTNYKVLKVNNLTGRVEFFKK